MGRKFKEMMENIPFIQAALESGQNTFTHSPLADTNTLHSGRHELNFHFEIQAF